MCVLLLFCSHGCCCRLKRKTLLKKEPNNDDKNDDVQRKDHSRFLRLTWAKYNDPPQPCPLFRVAGLAESRLEGLHKGERRKLGVGAG